MTENVAIKLNVLVIAIASFLLGASITGTYLLKNGEAITVKSHPVVNQTVQPVKEINKTEKVIVQERYNNIQPSHLDINYDKYGDEIDIENVDQLTTINGQSMQPTMFTGNTILMTEYSEDIELEEGMIVKTESKTVHRIRGNYLSLPDKNYVTTQGDSNTDHEKTRAENITHIAIGVLYT